MSFCKQCGIEIEAARDQCPLCNGALQESQGEKEAYLAAFKNRPYPEDTQTQARRVPWTNRQKRFFTFELISLLAVVSAAIIFSIYFLFARQAGWVYVTFISLGLVWLVVSIPLLFINHSLHIVLGEIAAILGFLAALDLQDGKLNWFAKLALPILVLVTLLTVSVVYTTKRVKTKGANIAGFILFGISLLTLGINIIISVFLQTAELVTWSAFVVIPATALALFLLYIHYRLSKIIDINKRFMP